MAEEAHINQTSRFTSILVLLFGLWLIAAPWLLDYPHLQARWNDVIVGVIASIAALLKAISPVRFNALSWVTVGLGIWLLVAPFLLQYGEDFISGYDPGIWNDVTVGIFMVVLSWISATITTKAR